MKIHGKGNNVKREEENNDPFQVSAGIPLFGKYGPRKRDSKRSFRDDDCDFDPERNVEKTAQAVF